MKIGAYGGIKFIVKQEDLLSFYNLSMDSGASWEEHQRIKKKNHLEFIGPDLRTLSLTVYADVRYGVKPMHVLSQLESIRSKGKAYYFTLGGKKLGSCLWVITSYKSTFTDHWKDGTPIKATFDLQLKEYPHQAKKKKKKPKKTKKNPTTKNIAKSKVSHSPKKVSYTAYTIKSGDTLFGLAKRFYGKGSSYMKIYNANRKKSKGYHVLTNPNVLSIGWKIKIPK